MSDTKGGLKYSLNISDKCEGCGICCVQYMDYFEELDDGRAKAKNKVVVLSGEEVEKIVQLCPCGAISCEAAVYEAVGNIGDLSGKISREKTTGIPFG